MGVVAAICVDCEQPFQVLEAERKRGWGRFCSRACSQRNRLRGKRSLNWHGGETHITTGHVCVYAPDDPHAGKNGYALKHRVVAARKLGRSLYSDEVVHHINGDVSDNRPENLQVMSQSQHLQLHNRLQRVGNRLAQRSVSLGS